MSTQLCPTQPAIAASRPALRQPVGLPLVTNGPDSANANANNNPHRRGRSWSRPPA